MRFCPTCGRAMRRDPNSGTVVFSCACGTTQPGDPSDARVGGAVLGATETLAMYSTLIKHAPFDPTNTRVSRPCPDCGLDYMVQLRIGEAEVIQYVCKCGYGSTAT